jgi:hypothetical protein
MLDYYGSIMISQNDLSIDIAQTPKYKMYSKIYIFEVVNYLFMKCILSDSYSLSGWNMFHKKDAITHIDNYIRLNTTKCKKMLALMLQLTNNTDLVYEPLLYKKICDNIKINYYK